MRPLALILPLVMLCSCQPTLVVDEPEQGDVSMFEPAKMRIHPIFTSVRDWTGDGNADGIEVLVEFQDQFGDPTKAAGTFMFELYDYRPAEPDPRGRRIVNPWFGSIVTLDEQAARWRRTSRSYIFQLAHPGIRAEDDYVLTAEFRTEAGRRYSDRVVLPGQEEDAAPATQPSPGQRESAQP